MDKIEIFFSRLGRFWGRALDAPMQMWRQTAGESGNRVMLIVFLIGFAAGALYLIVSFLKAPWRGKLKMLTTGLICALIILAVFWFALM